MVRGTGGISCEAAWGCTVRLAVIAILRIEHDVKTRADHTSGSARASASTVPLTIILILPLYTPQKDQAKHPTNWLVRPRLSSANPWPSTKGILVRRDQNSPFADSPTYSAPPEPSHLYSGADTTTHWDRLDSGECTRRPAGPGSDAVARAVAGNTPRLNSDLCSRSRHCAWLHSPAPAAMASRW